MFVPAYATALTALGDPTRLAIFESLVERRGWGYPVEMVSRQEAAGLEPDVRFPEAAGEHIRRCVATVFLAMSAPLQDSSCGPAWPDSAASAR